MKKTLIICVSLLLCMIMTSCGLIVPIRETHGGTTETHTSDPQGTTTEPTTAGTETEKSATTDAPSRVDEIIAQMTL